MKIGSVQVNQGDVEMKLRSLVGVFSSVAWMLVSSISNAAAPGPSFFDNWQVTGGNATITPGACPSGYSCQILTTGAGFLQQQLTETATNTSYIQTVITDTNAPDTQNPATLGYRDESFVQLGGSNGVLGHQVQSQVTNGTTFTSSSTLANGWANPTPSSTSPNMSITQSLDSPGGAATGDEFNNTFSMMIINDPTTGNVTDRSMSIDQKVGLGNGVTNSTDEQRFVLEQRQGAFTTANGSLTLAATSFDSNNQPINGGTVSWVSGDDVMVRWIGQRLDLGAQGTSQFGFEGAINNTTGPSSEKTTFSTTSTGIVTGTGPHGYEVPFDWNSIFNTATRTTAPTLP
jgi:hypothetical protein